MPWAPPSGARVEELVQTLVALMMANASWRLLYQAVDIHPTVIEGFFAVMNSVT
jgi:hypothetical protein